jgi:bacillopeptidase F (M6 metalloprotease family)
VTLGASPALSFWHWHALATSNGTDQAYVELSSDDGVSWDVVSNTYTGASPGWVHETLDLSAHSGETVRIAFRLLDITVNALITSAGWYIDDIEITPPPTGGEYAIGIIHARADRGNDV